VNRDTIDIELAPTERSLLLRYGYPFAQIEQALKACSASKAIETIPMDRFELERLIGDLSRSINELNGGRLQDQLLALCDRLEAAERCGDGMLDTL
jgi:DNA-binding transcriptional MerR regulator